jgi:hypothetical protein
VAVCQCGLSQNKPFCDGSHRVTRDEEPNKLYAYDREKKRVVLDDLFPDPGAEKRTPLAGVSPEFGTRNTVPGVA